MSFGKTLKRRKNENKMRTSDTATMKSSLHIPGANTNRKNKKVTFKLDPVIEAAAKRRPKHNYYKSPHVLRCRHTMAQDTRIS
jgi:hypothetical protein